MIFKFIRNDGQTLILDSLAWGIYEIEGLGYPDISFESQPYAFSDGSYWTKAQAEKRVIAFKAKYRRRDQNFFVRNKLGGFFNHVADYAFYILEYDGKDAYFEGKATSFEMPVKKANGLINFDLEFTSVNPFIQSVDDFGENLNTVIPMIHYPRVYAVVDEFTEDVTTRPYSVRAFAQNVPVTNEGSINTGFVATITFAENTSTFTIQNDKGEKIDITKSFVAGDVLQLDTKNGVCRLNGTKFYKGVSDDSAFFPLYPGINYITYGSAVGESTLDLDLYYRSQRMVF